MKTMLVYQSRSGFTKRYAEWIAQETGCRMIPLKAADRAVLSGCDVLVFGSRLHAGRLDGLGRFRKLYEESGAKALALFATGAAPNSAAETIEKMWSVNLTAEEKERIPHFYMQAGLCYERLGFFDRTLMKLAAPLIEKQNSGAPQGEQIARTIRSSYDISDRQYTAPLVEWLKSQTEG